MITASFRRLARLLPECLLLAAFLFFALRHLGTFPAAWADDSLFMLVAKSVAQGHGYALPILGWAWPRPYILAVGPSLILPVALAIKLGGFSVSVARLPMALYLLGAMVASYLFVQRMSGRSSARWTAALMISLSAFINTGKPVLGEIPGFFFLMLGLLAMQKNNRSAFMAFATGTAFGLAVMTKLPFGLVLPALGAAWVLAAIRRDRKEVIFLTIAAVSAIIVTMIGAVWMGAFDKGFLDELRIFLFEKKSVVPLDQFEPIITRPLELMRMAYGHFAFTAILAVCGWQTVRRKLYGTLSVIILSVAALFSLYFLNGPGWYRALLPSTLLLLLFVPAGARRLLGNVGSVLLLSVIVIIQGFWQFTGGGASNSTEAADAAQVLMAQWQERDLVILPPEVFVRLAQNSHWLFLSEELRDADRQPPEVKTRMEQTKCFPIFRKESHEDLERKKSTYLPVNGRYIVIPAPSGCPQS